jgi:DNA-binding NtrC family response regulator
MDPGGAQGRKVTVSRILIIDDDADIRRLLRVALERDHHDILEASDGSEGLRRWRDDRPDLVITDLVMPGKDGLDTLFEMVSLDPRVKVIAMTGGSWREAVDRLHDARLFGALRTVAKPFTLSEMLRVVGEVLGQ